MATTHSLDFTSGHRAGDRGETAFQAACISGFVCWFVLEFIARMISKDDTLRRLLDELLRLRGDGFVRAAAFWVVVAGCRFSRLAPTLGIASCLGLLPLRQLAVEFPCDPVLPDPELAAV